MIWSPEKLNLIDHKFLFNLCKNIVKKENKKISEVFGKRRPKKDELIKYIKQNRNLIETKEGEKLEGLNKEKEIKKIRKKAKKAKKESIKADDVYKKLENIYAKLDEILDKLSQNSSRLDKLEQILSSLSGIKVTVSDEEFIKTLNDAISRAIGPVGWASIKEVENIVTSKLNISHEAFEQKLRDIIEKNFDLYELSPGGDKHYLIGGKYYGLIRFR